MHLGGGVGLDRSFYVFLEKKKETLRAGTKKQSCTKKCAINSRV